MLDKRLHLCELTRGLWRHCSCLCKVSVHLLGRHAAEIDLLLLLRRQASSPATSRET